MRKTSLLFISILTLSPLLAQYSEVGIQLGLSNYSGELSEHKLKPNGFGSMIGVFGRYNFTKYLSAKASLTKASLSGDDKYAKSLDLKDRNLNFRSDVLELAVTGEINFSAYNIRAKQTGVPYFFTGIALAHFNPQAQMRGSWYDLQPMKTEGNKYNRYALAIPFGLGIKFNISYKVNFGIELGARKTFTDYLDDVSSHYIDVIELRKTAPTNAALAYRTPELTGSFGENPVGTERGDPGNKDWYFFGALTVSFNLTDKYGLDFDKKYEVFKDHLRKPEKAKKQRKNIESDKKSKRKIFKRKKYIDPVVKKRVD